MSSGNILGGELPDVLGTYTCFMTMPGNSSDESLTLEEGGSYKYEITEMSTQPPGEEVHILPDGDEDSTELQSSGNWSLAVQGVSIILSLLDTSGSATAAFSQMSLTVVGDHLVAQHADPLGEGGREFVKVGSPTPPAEHPV
jgi:hypothetical protein